MEENKKQEASKFNGVDQQQSLREAYQKEHDADPEAYTKIEDGPEPGDSVRSYGEAGGTTPGLGGGTMSSA